MFMNWQNVFLFFETMKCQVEDSIGNTYFIDLDLIKQHILHEYKEKLYVENCYSEMIKTFLEEEKGLSLVGQKRDRRFFILSLQIGQR